MTRRGLRNIAASTKRLLAVTDRRKVNKLRKIKNENEKERKRIKKEFLRNNHRDSLDLEERRKEDQVFHNPPILLL